MQEEIETKKFTVFPLLGDAETCYYRHYYYHRRARGSSAHMWKHERRNKWNMIEENKMNDQPSWRCEGIHKRQIEGGSGSETREIKICLFIPKLGLRKKREIAFCVMMAGSSELIGRYPCRSNPGDDHVSKKYVRPLESMKFPLKGHWVWITLGKVFNVQLIFSDFTRSGACRS